MLRRGFRITRKQGLGIALILSLVGLLWIALPRFGLNPHELHAKVAAMNPLLIFGLMTLLPIFGFSVGIIYVIAGVRFGTALGLVLISFATAVHLAASYWIGKSFLRDRIEALLAKRRHHLPKLGQTDRIEVALLTALVPGLPYAARNYLLGIAGIPLRMCLWICLPIYVLRSCVVVAFGEFSGNLTQQKVVLLVALLCVKVGISAYLIKHLRDRWLRKQRRAAHAAVR